MAAAGTYQGFIPVRDLAEARDFYAGVLGCEVRAEDPFGVVVDAGGTDVRLSLVADHRPPAYTVGGWRVEELHRTVTRLADAGVRFRRFEGMAQDGAGIWTAPSGEQVAWFADPAGNLLSLTGPATG